jgi:predicted RNA-binding protein with PIN domain
MRWLIDGYNVIRRDADLRAHEAAGLQAGRTALLAFLARIAGRLSDDFTVVFDGARPTGGAPSGGRVQVLFSRPPETADDVLRRLAATWREGAVVVTSDRAVRDSARRAGAVALTAEAFVEAATTPAEDSEDLEDVDDRDRAPRPGPGRRPSREARTAERALRRLRFRGRPPGIARDT